LIFCGSPGFIVPWFSSLTPESDLAYFLCSVWRRRGEGGLVYFLEGVQFQFYICISYFKVVNMMWQRQHLLAGSISNFQAPPSHPLSCMRICNIYYLVLLSDVNNSKKTRCCLVLKNQGKKWPKPETLGFLETTCIKWGRNQKTNEKPGRNPK
jgi:hypothetical protein